MSGPLVMHSMNALLLLSLCMFSDEADQLLADIDDMLADLTVHLDSMIPGSSTQSKSQL